MAQARGRQPGGDDGMARLADLLHNMMRDRPENRFRAPEFDGTQDVELFIRQFQDVAAANNWDAQATLLHLRKALVNRANDCGDGVDAAAIFAALRLRFGITPRQARDKLRYLAKDGRQSWHEFGATVERLINIAYPDLPAANRAELALDNFGRGIDNRALQRHLLAVPPANIPAAVRIAEEFMQVAGSSVKQRLNAVDHVEETTSVIQDGAMATRNQPDKFAELLEAVRRNTDAISKLMEGTVGQPANNRPGKPARLGLRCYNCGGPHFKRDCPKPITRVAEIQEENEQGPQDDQQ